MPFIEVNQVDDPRLAPYALVTDAARLRRAGWFVAEGRWVVERLLDERRYELESLLLSESARRALEPKLREQGVACPVYVCGSGFFERLTGHDFHRGCLGLARRPPPLELEGLLARSHVLVVLEKVANADNVGGVFRNAAAFGASAVLLDPSSVDPLYRKAIRTSMGHTLRVPFATLGGGSAPWPDCLSLLAENGFELIALTPHAPLDLDAFAALPERPQRFALLLGNEGAGSSPEALARATRRVRIGIRPGVDSLNLAVACGIALHRLLPASR